MVDMNYYCSLMNELKTTTLRSYDYYPADIEHASASKIINPYSFYQICHHYLSDEYRPTRKNNLMSFNAISKINNFDIIYVQSDLLEFFVNYILCHIKQTIILITGKRYLPQVHKSDITDKLIKNEKIFLWFSQNPIYFNSDKYKSIPYGIKIKSIFAYFFASSK